MIRHYFSVVALVTLSFRTLILAVSLSLAWLMILQPVYADLVPLGSQWKYLDDGSGYQADWQYPSFDDSAWASGFGPFGYGDGDENTVVSYGPDPKTKPISTFFRHQFDVLSSPSEPLVVRVVRDDGVIVYLNGAEVFRNNLPDGEIDATTVALSGIQGSDENKLQTVLINPELLTLGTNTFAVEIHQAHRASSDISFDLQLTDNPVIRGPYLQQASETGITVRWRTATSRDGVLRYGTDPADLHHIASDPTHSTEHIIALNGLAPDTRYYYSIGDSGREYPTSDNHYFDTHPTVGSAAPTRIWVLGDSGGANSGAASVRNAYTLFNGDTHSDVWLMLGDNAYPDGTDEQYQAAVFDMYPHVLSNSVLWPTLGNHDARTAQSATQSGNYYDIFTLPTNAESGGVASGTEAYYSFDYGNIHFVSLDSHDTDRSTDGAMATWLKNDLAANTQEWIIAFWHHPPYSKGSHDSDTDQQLIEMRTNILPILESHAVDLVLAGHSHSYERSMLIDGHYGYSDSFNNDHVVDGNDGDPAGLGAYTKFAGSNTGAVFSVAGSSSRLKDAPLDHPVMISNLVDLGSMVIDVQGNQLDAIFLDDDASVRDSFRIVHQPAPQTSPLAPDELSATVSTDNEVQLSWNDNARHEDNFVVLRSTDQMVWNPVVMLDANARSFTDTGLSPSTTYYYRVIARNTFGDSSPSNTVDVTIPVTPVVNTIEIGSALLDHDRVTGKRWTRVDFTPLITATHTIRVTWSGNADIRVKLFRVRSGDGTETIDSINDGSPALWTGTLDSSQQYYLAIWSASGSATYTATLEAENADPQDPSTFMIIDEGILDNSQSQGPRWVQLDFTSLAAGEHTIVVVWDDDETDVRFKVKEENGTSVSSTIRGTNPGIWTGTLNAGASYSLGLWSADGVANYTASIEVDGEN